MRPEAPDNSGFPGPPPLEIHYYTDPLCSWSWAFEAPWRRLRYELGNCLLVRHRMGGMLANWKSFSDPVNSVSRPAQMGPVWFQVRHLTGMPVDDRLWLEDPPASSYPACIACKAAEIQSPQAGELYLRATREAAMIQRRNIARTEVLLAIADEVAAENQGRFNADLFRRDFAGPAAVEAFREDLREARYLEIGRFPSLVLVEEGKAIAVMTGYRPYSTLREAIGGLLPSSVPAREIKSREEYAAYWGRITPQEIEMALPG